LTEVVPESKDPDGKQGGMGTLRAEGCAGTKAKAAGLVAEFEKQLSSFSISLSAVELAAAELVGPLAEIFPLGEALAVAEQTGSVAEALARPRVAVEHTGLAEAAEEVAAWE
jgi:hypothetical protein